MSSDTDRSKGKVKRWLISTPNPQIDYFVCLQQDDAGLDIYLRPVDFEERYLKLSFGSPISLRSSQEGLWFNDVDPIEKNLWGTTFYTVENSTFVRQFHECSSQAFEDWSVTHYAIYTSNYCLDVLSTEEPSISWESRLPVSE